MKCEILLAYLSARRFDMEEKVIRKGYGMKWKKTAAVILALALTAGAYGCGSSAEPAQTTAKEETAPQETQESAAAASTVQEPINPEEVKSEEVVKADDAAQSTSKKETEAQDAGKEQAPAASTAEKEKDVIEKPEVSEANTEAEKEKEENKKEEEEAKQSTQNLNDVLDGAMKFDGMDLQFPIEISGMKLGKWTLTLEYDGDPSTKSMAPMEAVTAKMTSPDFTDDDVIVKAEFGNYSDSEVMLSDLPMTGIYITKGKGKDGAEPKLPALELPCGFTGGTPASEVQAQLGEASLSGTFDYDFDFMYENGEYVFEVSGMNDTGIEYVVYSVE